MQVDVEIAGGKIQMPQAYEMSFAETWIPPRPRRVASLGAVS